MTMFKASCWVLAASLFLHWLLPTAARAHSEQTQPSEVQIVARRDYLVIQISGDAADWRDVVANNPNHDHGASGAKISNFSDARQAAARYAENGLILEQNGQVLPLRTQKVEWKQLRSGDDSSARVEILLRAERPAKLAAAPLNVASDLFGNLQNARTIVQLGGEQKVIQGAKTAEFAAARTLPNRADDLRNFASRGALEPIGNIAQLFLLASLFLGASLAPPRRLTWALGALILGQSMALALDVIGGFSMPALWSGAAFALSILLLGGVSYFTAQRAETSPNLGRWWLAIPAFLGGLACGFSYAAPIRVWGLPESGLGWCVLAFAAGIALVQGLLALFSSAGLQHLQRKFTHQAQYGGMNWPRAVQIASLICVVGGTLYGLQQFSI